MGMSVFGDCYYDSECDCAMRSSARFSAPRLYARDKLFQGLSTSSSIMIAFASRRHFHQYSFRQYGFQLTNNQQTPRPRRSKTKYTLADTPRAVDGDHRAMSRARRHPRHPCHSPLKISKHCQFESRIALVGEPGSCTFVDEAILLFLGTFGELKSLVAARTRCLVFSLPHRGGVGGGFGR